MDTYIWETFTKKISVKGTLSEVYNAWTIPNEIEKWFLSKANYYSPSGELIAKDKTIHANDNYEWSWFSNNTIEKGKISKANGTNHLQFTFAGSCLVDVKLTQHDDGVIVELIQSNIPTDNQSKRGIRIGCDFGWSFYLLNLKSVLEGGIDLRNKNEELKGMLNN